MYRQGLGDCFLLRFRGRSGQPFHVVIDSGVLLGTPNAALRMREVAEDIERETSGRIDVLVLTHEHWDHLSAFAQARELWERMEIAELWLAWTEDPEDPLAIKLRAEREERRTTLRNRITALANTASLRLDAARAERLDAILAFAGLGLAAVNGSDTSEALAFAKTRARRLLYFQPGTSFTKRNLSRVRVFVLGPPKDERLIKKSDPSRAHPEVYSDPALAFGMSAFDPLDPAADPDLPFGPETGERITSARDYDQYFERSFPTLVKDGPDPPWRRLEIESLADLERLALALDGDTNNTSLALAFELDDGKVLLFPADAQVGNWLSWHDHTWRVRRKSVRAEDLLARTIVYKVGHHGSHNATLKDKGLELMTHRDLIALIPVDQTTARKRRWKMPFPPLHERLLEKTLGRVVLADAAEPLPQTESLERLTASERRRFSEQVVASELFIDVLL
jgi:hypothetical protein